MERTKENRRKGAGPREIERGLIVQCSISSKGASIFGISGFGFLQARKFIYSIVEVHLSIYGYR